MVTGAERKRAKALYRQVHRITCSRFSPKYFNGRDLFLSWTSGSANKWNGSIPSSPFFLAGSFRNGLGIIWSKLIGRPSSFCVPKNKIIASLTEAFGRRTGPDNLRRVGSFQNWFWSPKINFDKGINIIIANIDYWKLTADSEDDDRFKFDFAVGQQAPDYSYNWPYDLNETKVHDCHKST